MWLPKGKSGGWLPTPLKPGPRHKRLRAAAGGGGDGTGQRQGEECDDGEGDNKNDHQAPLIPLIKWHFGAHTVGLTIQVVSGVFGIILYIELGHSRGFCG